MTEGPYKLPEGWRWVTLGEVAYKPQYGYTASAISEPVGPKFIRITDITSGNIVWDDVPYCKCNSKVLEKYRVYPGDILFARTGSVGATILIKEVPYEAVFASYLIRVRLRKEVLPEYVDWVLKSPVCQNQLIPQGAAQKNINAQLITQILIPLPPLAEQRRIVARIEELMDRVREARRLRQEAQKDAECLWQAVLAQTLPRPGSDLPEGWRWVRLGEVAWRDAITLQPRDQPDAVFHYLGMEHVAPGQWDEPTPVELRGAEIKSQVIVYRPGLVLYGKLRPYLNKVVVPSAEGIASTEFVPIAVNSDVLEPRYLGAYLRSPSFVALDLPRFSRQGNTDRFGIR
jgi:restriction endonuclease S subunit